MASAIPTIPLHDGAAHPALGYGTYKVGYVPPSASGAAAEGAGATTVTCAAAVTDALAAGYRCFDCAEFYNNEADVGAAIRASGVPRGELFLISKVWTTTIHAGPAAVQARLERTLRDLGTDYLDVYSVHWPVPGKHVAAYRQLDAARRAGLVRGLGLSNYTVEDYEELKAACGGFPAGGVARPVVNQIEINPFLHRAKTIAHFRADGVVLQSYRALRNGKAFAHPVVVAVAAKHAKTPAQVLGRWCVQHGYVYLPKSVRRDRMEENAGVFGWELDAEDLAELGALTTPEALETFRGLYRKCVLRDTPDAGNEALIRSEITVD